MTYQRITLIETTCPECGATINAFYDGEQMLYEMHFRRDPRTKYMNTCSETHKPVRTKTHERDLIICG